MKKIKEQTRLLEFGTNQMQEFRERRKWNELIGFDKTLKTLLISLFIPFIVLYCSTTIPKSPNLSCKKVITGWGPEDFVILKNNEKTRLIVSSHERRKWKTQGDIFSHDIINNKLAPMVKLKRTGEPKNLFFAPHGIDLLKINKKTRLYIVNHGKKRNDANHQVLIYEVNYPQLKFIKQIKSRFFYSPNDIKVMPNGTFYVTNDAKNRGSTWDMFWSLKNSSVIFCSPTKKEGCKIVANTLAMANGVETDGKSLFIATTREDSLYQFSIEKNGNLKNKKLITRQKGLDNLFWHNDNLVTASHLSDWRFLRHASNPSNPAPSLIFEVDLKTGEKRIWYANIGTQIPAATGAIILNKKMYISQVFENYVLSCNLNELNFSKLPILK